MGASPRPGPDRDVFAYDLVSAGRRLLKNPSGARCWLSGMGWEKGAAANGRPLRQARDNADRPESRAPSGFARQNAHLLRCAPRHRRGARNRSPRGPREGDRAVQGAGQTASRAPSSRSAVASPVGAPAPRCAVWLRPSSRASHPSIFRVKRGARRVLQQAVRMVAAGEKTEPPLRSLDAGHAWTNPGSTWATVLSPTSQQEVVAPP